MAASYVRRLLCVQCYVYTERQPFCRIYYWSQKGISSEAISNYDQVSYNRNLQYVLFLVEIGIIS